MVLTRTTKILTITKVFHQINGNALGKCTRWNTTGYLFQKPVNLVINSNIYIADLCQLQLVDAGRRPYCTDGRGKADEDSRFPALMEFPEIVWPSIIKTLRNWVLANLIIRPYFDNEFNLPDFVAGSKQALQV